MSVYGDFLVVFLVAAASTYALVFPIRRLAVRHGVVAHPSPDRVHTTATPTVGGAAMFIGFAVAMLVASRLPGLSSGTNSIFHGSSEPLGVVLGALVIYSVGLIDDVRDISAPAKVAGQVLAAMVLVFLGVTMYFFKFPFVPGIINLSPSILPLITALWVVGMANAVNLIDGLDGLAAGIVAIAAGTLCIYGLRLVAIGDLSADNRLGPLVAAMACGVCIGFLPHNFHPARVFMGDGGALFLGLVMAAATMIIGGRTEGNVGPTDAPGLTFFRFAPLFIPFFILGVPILDTAFAIIRRTIHRSGVSERDLGHLHHRLVALGHGHRRAVLILWGWTAVLSVFVLIPAFEPGANAYVPFVVAFLCVALYTVFRPAGARVHSSARGRWRSARRARNAPAVGSESLGHHGSPISVVVSGAAGVASAGELELALPKHSKPARRWSIGRFTSRRSSEGLSSADAVANGHPKKTQVARPNDQMRG